MYVTKKPMFLVVYCPKISCLVYFTAFSLSLNAPSVVCCFQWAIQMEQFMLVIGAMTDNVPPGSRILYFSKSSLIDNTTASDAQAQFGPMRQTSLLTEHTEYVYVCGSYISYIKVSINCCYLCRNSCSLVPRPNFLLTLT